MHWDTPLYSRRSGHSPVPMAATRKPQSIPGLLKAVAIQQAVGSTPDSRICPRVLLKVQRLGGIFWVANGPDIRHAYRAISPHNQTAFGHLASSGLFTPPPVFPFQTQSDLSSNSLLMCSTKTPANAPPNRSHVSGENLGHGVVCMRTTSSLTLMFLRKASSRALKAQWRFFSLLR